jgi:hypothetical protein
MCPYLRSCADATLAFLLTYSFSLIVILSKRLFWFLKNLTLLRNSEHLVSNFTFFYIFLFSISMTVCSCLLIFVSCFCSNLIICSSKIEVLLIFEGKTNLETSIFYGLRSLSDEYLEASSVAEDALLMIYESATFYVIFF